MSVLRIAVAVMAVGIAIDLQAAEIAPTDVVFKDDTIVEASLTGVAGDPASGRAVFADRKQGNCLACHVNAELSEESFHGEVGPPLDGVADRYSEVELRAIVINSKRALSEETIMPGFYDLELGVRVLDDFAGKTILTAQQVEDVIAYLSTLKE